jgi:hypothetical protein
MSRSEIEHAIRIYARRHHMFAHTVRVCSVLRFAAIRAYKLEALLRAH